MSSINEPGQVGASATQDFSFFEEEQSFVPLSSDLFELDFELSPNALERYMYNTPKGSDNDNPLESPPLEPSLTYINPFSIYCEDKGNVKGADEPFLRKTKNRYLEMTFAFHDQSTNDIVIDSVNYRSGNNKKSKMTDVKPNHLTLSANILSENSEEPLSSCDACKKHGAIIHLIAPTPKLNLDPLNSQTIQFRIMCIPSCHKCTKFIARFTLSQGGVECGHFDMELPPINASRSKARGLPYARP